MHPILTHPDFLNEIKSRIQLHHSLYKSTRVSADLWEEVIVRSLEKLGYSVDWNSGSHKVGTDILLKDNSLGDFTLSAKSGVYEADKNTLTFSGSRLGTYKNNFTDMLEHIKKTQSDVYLFAAGEKSKNRSNHTYSIFAVAKSKIDYAAESQWRDTSDKPNIHTQYLKADVRPSMSHQLWTTLKLEPLLLAPNLKLNF
jgi:hypothetical protein